MLAVGVTMAMNPDTAQRAMRAYDLMVRTGLGARPATEMCGTTSRTLVRWMDDNGIPWSYRRRGRGRPLQIVPQRTPQQLIPDFLEGLGAGRSATAVSADLGTTIATMASQTLPDRNGVDRPIMTKDPSSGRWKPAFVPVHRYSTVVYGKLESMDGTTLGRGGQAGPNASTTRGDNYTDIWWQFDLDPLTSTLDPVDAVRHHRDAILETLRRKLMRANISGSPVASSFLGSGKVRGAAVAANRWSGSGPLNVTMLEELLQRFNLRLVEVRMGVDDNVDPSGPRFMAVSDLSGPGPIKMPTGRFQVFFLDKNDVQAYPADGVRIRYRYDMSQET